MLTTGLREYWLRVLKYKMRAEGVADENEETPALLGGVALQGWGDERWQSCYKGLTFQFPDGGSNSRRGDEDDDDDDDPDGDVDRWSAWCRRGSLPRAFEKLSHCAGQVSGLREKYKHSLLGGRDNEVTTALASN